MHFHCYTLASIHVTKIAEHYKMLPFKIVYIGLHVTVWMFDAHCYGIKSLLFAEKMSWIDYLTRSLPRAKTFYTMKRCFKDINFSVELYEEICNVCLVRCVDYIQHYNCVH